jgi:hypothetical protein
MEKEIKEINPEVILSEIDNKSKIFLPFNELDKILSFSKIIFDQNTLISDYIRILKIDNHIIVQEKTDKDELALHLVKDELEAEKLVNERLDTYEKMWDGCGCKVKYYD